MHEEWVSTVKQTFRMDLIELPSGIRKTYLFDKSTEEKFFFKPFVCSLVDDDFKSSLDPKLRDFLPKSPSAFIPTGIGALWFYALQFEADYTAPKDVDLKKRGGGGASHTLRNYARYKIQTSDKFPYKLEFYFRPRIAESSKSIALIQILDGLTEKVVMRIKVLELDLSWKASVIEKSDLFDLPLGYGCQRGEKFDPYLIEMPSYISLVNFEPHLLRVDMVASRPLSIEHDFERWKTHASSVKILTGRFKLNHKRTNDYLLLELTDYAPPKETPKILGTEIKHATSRKVKQVWDLGSNGPDSKGGQRVVYFKQDEKNRICLVNGDNYLLKERSTFPVPLFSSTDAPDDRNLQSQLDVMILMDLFSSTSDYHLLSQKETRLIGLQTEFVYEKRVKSFEIRDASGVVLWFGPVSIIRKDIKQKAAFDNVYKTTITINFYSKDYSAIITRVVLDLIEAGPIDQAYFHQQLDVSLCLEQASANEDENFSYTSLLKSEQNGGENMKFTLSYPLESEEMCDRLASSDSAQADIYEKFLKALFDVSNERLDMLQVVDVGLDYGGEMLKISGKLLKKPHLLSYTEIKEQKIVCTDRTKQLFSEIKSTSESCAESCNHYGCTAFVYCPAPKVCDLLLKDLSASSNDGRLKINFEPEPYCSLFTPIDANKLRHIEPAQLISHMRELMLEEKYDIDKEYGRDEKHGVNPSLEIKIIIDRSSVTNEKQLELFPILIESDDESADEQLENLAEESLKDFDGSHGELERGREKRKRKTNRPEYRVLFENRKFRQPVVLDDEFVVQEAKHMSYDECELFCDQIDCRSFSHCFIDGTCLVTSIHKKTLVEQKSFEEPFCFIFEREYLSKFQKTIQTTRPLAHDPIKSAPTVLVDRECALNCMDNDDDQFKCRSFYFCPSEKAYEFDCYLSNNHNPEDVATNTITSCDYYVRKYHVN